MSGIKGTNRALNLVKKYHPQVARVVDAKTGVKIEVTKKDCSRANKKSPSSCAMARAFERNYDGAIISMATAYLIKGDKAIRYKVPSSVAREIVSFDRHQDFAPGKYSLRAPSVEQRLGSKHKRPPYGPKTGKKAVHRHKTAGIRAL